MYIFKLKFLKEEESSISHGVCIHIYIFIFTREKRLYVFLLYQVWNGRKGSWLEPHILGSILSLTVWHWAWISSLVKQGWWSPTSKIVVRLMWKFLKSKIRWTLKVLQKHVSLLEWLRGTVLYKSNVPVVFPKFVSFQMQLHIYENTLLNKDVSLQKVGSAPSHEVLWDWLVPNHKGGGHLCNFTAIKIYDVNILSRIVGFPL